MLNKLLLQSRNDIPFNQAQLIIHQPRIKEIAYIGQDTFFIGCEYLNFSKDRIKEEDKIHLEEYSNFEVLMTIMKEDNVNIKKIKTSMELVLSLLFPDYSISFLPMSILLSKPLENNSLERHLIDKENFESFRNIVSEICCLSQIMGKSSSKYNPGGPQATALVNKFLERERKLAKMKNKGREKQGISIIERYLSILSVGLQKDKNQLLQYTIYQLFDQFRRFKMKESFDMYVQAKMAGAKDIGEIENWMGDITSDTL